QGDPAMLRQAFLNLALNACQAMPGGGTLTIRCETARPSARSGRPDLVEGRGNRALVTFTDTGVGIKPEHLPRIFELYFTTREKASGICLSIVSRTAQMHAGETEGEWTTGTCTTFSNLLPRAGGRGPCAQI